MVDGMPCEGGTPTRCLDLGMPQTRTHHRRALTKGESTQSELWLKS